GSEGELGHGRTILDTHGDRRPKAKRQLAVARSADEEHLRVAATLGRVDGARIVEARIAAHLEAHVAPHRLRPTYQVVRLPDLFHGHEIGDLGDAVGTEEARQQHIAVGKIELLACGFLEQRRNLEPSAALRVDEGREDRRRVEVGQTEEVDRCVHAHQGDGVEVADDPVFADGCVAIRHRARAYHGRKTQGGWSARQGLGRSHAGLVGNQRLTGWTDVAMTLWPGRRINPTTTTMSSCALWRVSLWGMRAKSTITTSTTTPPRSAATSISRGETEVTLPSKLRIGSA